MDCQRKRFQTSSPGKSVQYRKESGKWTEHEFWRDYFFLFGQLYHFSIPLFFQINNDIDILSNEVNHRMQKIGNSLDQIQRSHTNFKDIAENMNVCLFRNRK